MPSQQLTTEDIHTLPVVLDALRNPRSPRSVLNYMCACDTSDPKVRDLLNTEEKVGPLLSIWFASGTALDALCLVLSRFSSGLFRAIFAMKEIWNGKEIHRRVSP